MSSKDFGQKASSGGKMDVLNGEGAETDVQVMGIVNLTDDSFYPGSRVLSASGEFVPETFLSRVREMVADGASIIDVGACSTRPGSDSVDAETEWTRLEPALQMLKETFSFKVSIDTFRPEIVRKAYNVLGPFIVNDISGGSEDMLALVGQLGLPYIATCPWPGIQMPATNEASFHNSPATPSYDTIDVTAAVKKFFKEFEIRAERFGISDWILDPGFGFGKTIGQNWQLLRELPQLQCFGRKILVGVSRKSMIWKPLGITPAEALPGTQVANFAALQGGANIIRVHDVLEAVHTIKLWHLLKRKND